LSKNPPLPKFFPYKNFENPSPPKTINNYLKLIQICIYANFVLLLKCRYLSREIVKKFKTPVVLQLIEEFLKIKIIIK